MNVNVKKRANSQTAGMHLRLLLMARVGGWVMGMQTKITRTLGDVGVPSFWLDPTLTGACRGEGGLAI